jgi:hypothetical protein
MNGTRPFSGTIPGPTIYWTAPISPLKARPIVSTLELNLSHKSGARASDPVECLGQTFPSDAARREHFTARLRAALEELYSKLDVPFNTADDAVVRLRSVESWPMGDDERLRELAERMRGAERGKGLLQRWKDEVGFPHGELEDILRLSDPPFYTACPNPFLGEFIQAYGRPYDPSESYHREPFAADVSEGKNDPIYNAHSYHTKVPHKAIMRYILHYTEPGDVVFDGFCGTGMTGVAAQMCGDRKVVESLGYRVQADGTILVQEEGEGGQSVWKPFSKLGVRRAVLNDLSPAATFIAYNYNTPVDAGEFEREAKRILTAVENECAWMYATLHKPTSQQLARAVHSHDIGEPSAAVRDSTLPWGRINYTVWSDVFTCPECAGEVVFWNAAVDQVNGKVLDAFPCPQCRSVLTKRSMERAWVTSLDRATQQTVRMAKHVPVLINYTYNKKRFDKTPDSLDKSIVRAIDESTIPHWYPTDETPKGFNTEQPRASHGVNNVHQFYTSRNLWVLASLRNHLRSSSMEDQLLCLVGDQLPRASRMHKIAVSRLNTNLSKTAGVLAGTLYIPSNQIEYSVVEMIGYRIDDVASYLSKRDRTTRQLVETVSTTAPSGSDNCLDYIFLDPPFGGNLMYSELNFLWEAWLQVRTNNGPEAIENSAQRKTIDDYRHLMTSCFAAAYRRLKPGRWMTVEFSNTQASVWNAIQTALQEVGFVVANVSALDKKQGTHKAVTTPTAVKQDLVISAYKPATELEERFTREGGKEQSVWDFTRSHLERLPRFKRGARGPEFISERDPRILYDRLVAWFVRHGVPVPLSSQEFQAGLAQRYPERDGMYFLPDQVAEYDRKVRQIGAAPQQELFVSDERSAIDWLREFLKKRPSVNSDIQPEFMKQLGAGWSKHEARPEMRDLLELNFLQYDGKGEVPSQIHSYLSHSYAELRNLSKDDPKLVARAKDRWYVPDPNKAIDLEKLRDKQLLKEFEEYRGFGGRKLKVFRLEAVRAGFRRAWQEKDYATIVEVAAKIPDAVLQEDPLLLRWYDQAMTRMGLD